MKKIVEVSKLSKIYKFNEDRKSYSTIRDHISSLEFLKHRKDQTFYALKNINFSISEGETLGLIGKNGAGKSTLIKILSNITLPTKGEVTLRGRTATLLEVGTGFHPELSGRDNIFLNGAILGMRKTEIQRKFDEIVDFSGIEKFLDTPVKHYSSGMYARLAFSVAAHLEEDILIIDEVLAVGDANFQKKSLNKIKQVSNSGRTVIFVSHNLSAINSICSKTLLLDRGNMVDIGNTPEIISKYVNTYLDKKSKNNLKDTRIKRNTSKNSKFNFLNIWVESQGDKKDLVTTHQPFKIGIDVDLRHEVRDGVLSLSILSELGHPIYNSQISFKELNLKKGKSKLYLNMNPNIFGPGVYTIGLGANGESVLDWIPEAISFTIRGKQVPTHVFDGLAVFPRKWEIK